MALSALAAAAVLAAAFWHRTHDGDAFGGSPALRLAVLPFENEGPSNRAYLADGIADGVRGKLAALPAVRVIASSSSEGYRGGQKPLPQVGRELGVGHVIVGSVRWIGDSLEVVPRLLETGTGRVTWQEHFEATADDAIQLESEIVSQVASALGLPLSRPDKLALNDSLTRSPAAYDAYLRGLEARRQFDHYNGSIQSVIALFRRAVELDPGFALAKVKLADALRSVAMATGDTTRFREADSLLASVLRVHPDLADAYVVRAEIRQYQKDTRGAYQLLLQAATLQKNNAFVLGRLAWLQAVEGDSAAVRTGAMAVALAPRDPDMLRRVIAGTSIFRHFSQLESYCDQLIELSPDDQMGYLNKALAQVWSRSDTAGALETLRGAERSMGRFQTWMMWPYAMAGPSGWKRLRGVTPAVLSTSDNPRDRVDFYYWKARIARAERRPKELRADADSIIALVSRTPSSLPSYGTLLLARGFAYGVHGDRPKAARDLKVAEAALAGLPESWSNQSAPDIAELYALVGDTSRAEAEVRRALEQPTGFTKRALSLSPEFLWLWGTPRLQRLLADNSLP